MVDYWVSRERRCCKYCNVWMPSDKTSIKHHEQGRKHKEKVEEVLELNRRTKLDAKNAQKEIQNQLQRIEEAAHAKFEQDLVRCSTKAQVSTSGQTVASSLPPFRPTQIKAVSCFVKHRNEGDAVSVTRLEHRQPWARGALDRLNSKENEEVNEEEEEEGVEEQDDKGVYAVKGIVYLEGKKHETQLDSGSACQIWVEEQEQWLDALVEQATVHTILNTELSFRRFTIAYMSPSSQQCAENEDKRKPVTEHNVLADRLRIPLPANVTLEAAEKMVERWRNHGAAESPTWTPVVIDETTGMGEWNTVEVRQIDESLEAVAQREKEAEAETARRNEEQQCLESLENLSSQGDNALGAFNPWGGTYKGLNLDSNADATAPGHVASSSKEMASGSNVSFKKRGQKKQKRRRIHTDEDE
uniref:Matrin-type domain-containing protein n=1 Tax=Peronospora matthiolae TaxID=2874970 RepID=A0AAV1T5I4_9STRA